MSTKPLMLDGVIAEPGERDGLLREWRREKQRMEDELRALRAERDDVVAERDNIRRSVQALRRQLSGLYNALRALFGEIELAVGEEEAAAPGPANQQASRGADPRWESYKQSFPGAPARIVDALLAHREMTVTQLSKLLKMDYGTAKSAVMKLRQAGAISKESERGGPVRLVT
jgi:hypothetical protein